MNTQIFYLRNFSQQSCALKLKRQYKIFKTVIKISQTNPSRVITSLTIKTFKIYFKKEYSIT